MVREREKDKMEGSHRLVEEEITETLPKAKLSNCLGPRWHLHHCSFVHAHGRHH